MFSRKDFDAALCELSRHYEKTSPVVSDYMDTLSSRRDETVTLAHLRIVQEFVNERPQGNLAANKLYHFLYQMGEDTQGMLGY